MGTFTPRGLRNGFCCTPDSVPHPMCSMPPFLRGVRRTAILRGRAQVPWDQLGRLGTRYMLGPPAHYPGGRVRCPGRLGHVISCSREATGWKPSGTLLRPAPPAVARQPKGSLDLYTVSGYPRRPAHNNRQPYCTGRTAASPFGVIVRVGLELEHHAARLARARCGSAFGRRAIEIAGPHRGQPRLWIAPSAPPVIL